ncbi:hypothetical protein SDC49_07625 [Lactobacillus sp. R2/2]|nr:hypothetical protein [Lactobacillus sp. R2/2]MEB3363651.1 hypothetical protein [Lactobacillus sp. R2/2]
MKILLTSHGHLAQGIASGFEFIAGKSDYIMILALDERGIGSYRDRLQELLDGETEPVLILADLKGGTPYNESFKYYLAHTERIRVVSGLNLPMLLELVPQLSDNTTLDEAVQTVLQAGTNGIAVAQDQQDDDDDIEF